MTLFLLGSSVATLILLPLVSCDQAALDRSLRPPAGPEVRAQAGIWGGDHASMVVTGTGVTLEFDCAHGAIDGPLVLDETGGFAADGLYFQERGGPVGESDPPAPVKARYAGQVTDIQMTLTVVIPDTQEKIGAYSLTLGAAAHLTKCL